MKTGTVTSTDGTSLFYRDTGGDLPAIVLIHGYLQNSLSWQFQLSDRDLTAGFRLVAPDLRGHGRSGKPAAEDAYLPGERWADDVAALLDGLAIERALLVGWSYGGYVIGDFLRHRGTARLMGAGMVGTTFYLGGEPARRMSTAENGAMFGALVSSDAGKSGPALERFGRALTAAPVDDKLYYEFLGYGACVPPPARLHMMRRIADNSDVARGAHIPIWVPHGSADAVIPLSQGEEIATTFPQARLSVFEGVGHTPFVEDPARFNAELFAFAEAAFFPGTRS
jgi:pimeloyl-ACP methyl ester carboxylesterase